MDERSHVWLITGDPVRRQHWRAALDLPDCQVLDSDQVSGQRIDVIVADRPLTAAEIAALPTSAARGHCGLVAVGWSGAADVQLGADSTDRELRLACSLLGRIARQRRAIARHARERELLRHLALSDPLTGLANRRAWDDEFPRRVAEASAAGRALVLAIVDLDQLKETNQCWGHAAGDRLLRATAQGLTAATTSADFVARLGGDEFAVLCAAPDQSAAPGTIGRLSARVHETLQCAAAESPPSNVQATSDASSATPPTISVGWVLITPSPPQAPHDWLAKSDRALRAAKRLGPAQSVAYRAELEDAS